MGTFGYSIGIDIGGTSIKVGLVQLKEWEIISRLTVPLERYKTPELFFESIPETINNLLDKTHVKKNELCGIGIGVPGCVDSINGVVKDLTNLSGWHHEVPIKAQLEKITGIPTFIDNDVNLMAIAELVNGACKGCSNVLCVTLGTGVGGGIILNGKIYRGSTLTAGEVGHMTLFKDGLKCNCGNRGCLERYVGNAAIVQRTKDAIQQNRSEAKILLDLIGGDLDELTPKVIAEAAYKGDTASIRIWQETGDYIGIIFAGMVNVFNPDKIVVGGGVAQAGDILFDAIHKAILERSMPVAAQHVELVSAMLGEEAGIYGSAIYSVKDEFHEEKK